MAKLDDEHKKQLDAKEKKIGELLARGGGQGEKRGFQPKEEDERSQRGGKRLQGKSPDAVS